MHRSTGGSQSCRNYHYCSFQHCNGLSLLTPAGRGTIILAVDLPPQCKCHMGYIFFVLCGICLSIKFFSRNSLPITWTKANPGSDVLDTLYALVDTNS